MTSYQRLLRDPRWQKKRLQILARDQWTCQQCAARDKELQVHHRRYVAGQAPWEVPARALVTLCVTCHRAHRQKARKARTTVRQKKSKRRVI